MLQPGDHVPDFQLDSDTAGTVSAQGLRGQRYVLYFYPKDDTPGCTVEACSFRDNLPAFQQLGVPVFGVSADEVSDHERFAKKFSLNFPLLSDPSHAALEAFGTWVEKNMYGRTYMGVARATFVIDAEGRIEKVWAKVTPENHAEEVRAFLAGEPAPAPAPKAAKPRAPKTPKAAPVEVPVQPATDAVNGAAVDAPPVKAKARPKTAKPAAPAPAPVIATPPAAPAKATKPQKKAKPVAAKKAGKASKPAAKKATAKPAKASKPAPRKAAKKAAKPVKKAARKGANKAVKKVVKKAAKPVKKAAKKTPKKAAKPTKKIAKKAPRKAAKKSARAKSARSAAKRAPVKQGGALSQALARVKGLFGGKAKK